jgi:mannosylglycoprotein endo-beta-mannosidase
MSSVVRLTLINSSLSSLTTFAMGMFLLAKGTHAGFDKHIARFFWEGIGDKRKFHWVNWPAVCRPKDQGGLGVINSRFMNIALMIKWIWRLFHPSEQDNLWYKLLQAKYVNSDNIFATSTQGGSQFWRSLNKIKHFFKLGSRFVVGNGRKTLFWTDCWLGESPLAVRFARLFDICASKEILVAEALPVSATLLQFRRSFGPVELDLWAALVQETSSVELSNIGDTVRWDLEPSGRFSVLSLYRKINQGPSLPHESILWSAKLPLKIKIFLWQMAKGRLPSNDQINRRHGASNGSCALCGQLESVDHIFFVCDLAAFAWSGIREAFGVQWNPRTFQEFFAIVNSLSPGFKHAIWLLFAAQSWALWNIRNKITIEHKLPSHPADCIFKTSLFLQLWRPLLKNKLSDKMDIMLELLRVLYLHSRVASTPTSPNLPQFN